MPYQHGRFTQLRWMQTLSCVAAIFGASVLVLLGIVGYGQFESIWLTAAGGFGLFLAIILMTITPLLLKMESTLSRQLELMRDLGDAYARQTQLLETIVENTRISDAAKSLAHREQEVEALRRAIRDRIRNQQWEPASALIDEIERRFSQKQEADRIREELEHSRRAAIQTRRAEAIEMIESHFRSKEWDRAAKEIERLAHALPGDDQVVSLQDRLKAMKEQQKEALLKEWDEAVRRNDTDHAIDVLRELDQYLTPVEAQSLQTSARHVFKEKLLQLGVQFRFAVTERRWQDALRTGLELVREFPNARMAAEVREALDTLRERARVCELEAETAGRSRP